MFVLTREMRDKIEKIVENGNTAEIKKVKGKAIIWEKRQVNESLVPDDDSE